MKAQEGTDSVSSWREGGVEMEGKMAEVSEVSPRRHLCSKEKGHGYERGRHTNNEMTEEMFLSDIHSAKHCPSPLG